MATTNEVLERVAKVRPDALGEGTKAKFIIELNGKLFQELIKTHRLSENGSVTAPVFVCPKCGSSSVIWDEEADSYSCSECGWDDYPEIPETYPEDGSVSLLAKSPYDSLYDLYIMAQIDFYNREYDNYNNSALAFNNALEEYKRFYHRSHLPLRDKRVKYIR